MNLVEEFEERSMVQEREGGYIQMILESCITSLHGRLYSMARLNHADVMRRAAQFGMIEITSDDGHKCVTAKWKDPA